MTARKLCAAIAAATTLSLGGAGAAQAATSLYHPDPAARSFSGSAGGWTASTTYTNGLCIAGVTCPAVNNTFVPGGGSGGASDGFIQSNLAGLLSLLSTTRATWQSPAFTYAGAQGQQATSVSFQLSRRTDAAALLGLLSAADYSVHVDDVDAGTSTTVVDQAPITNLASWTADPKVAVDPSRLVVGRQYRIRIVTELDLPVAVLNSGTFGYDDVVLSADAPDSDSGSGSLAKDLKNGVLGGSARLRGKRLFVPVRCPQTAPAKCKVKLAGKLKGKRSKAITKTGKVKVEPGTKKVAKLKVKRRFLSKVRKRKKMVFRVNVRSGTTKVKFHKKLKLARK